MRTVRSHRSSSLTHGVRRAGHATLGWLRNGQLGPDGHEIWSHPAGQWRF